LAKDQILITPTGVHKGYLMASDMAVVDLKSRRVVSGKPSGERLMHLEVYRHCPEANAVIHAHPPTAIAWTIAKPDLQELPADGMSELILAVGKIPIVPYARPGSQDMGDAINPYLKVSRVMILARHGALSWGESLDEAYRGMERLEHAAHILKLAVELGGITSLPPSEIKHLRQLRTQIGNVSL